jgi:hypothetical protein
MTQTLVELMTLWIPSLSVHGGPQTGSVTVLRWGVGCLRIVGSVSLNVKESDPPLVSGDCPEDIFGSRWYQDG